MYFQIWQKGRQKYCNSSDCKSHIPQIINTSEKVHSHFCYAAALAIPPQFYLFVILRLVYPEEKLKAKAAGVTDRKDLERKERSFDSSPHVKYAI